MKITRLARFFFLLFLAPKAPLFFVSGNPSSNRKRKEEKRLMSAARGTKRAAGVAFEIGEWERRARARTAGTGPDSVPRGAAPAAPTTTTRRAPRRAQLQLQQQQSERKRPSETALAEHQARAAELERQLQQAQQQIVQLHSELAACWQQRQAALNRVEELEQAGLAAPPLPIHLRLATPSYFA